MNLHLRSANLVLIVLSASALATSVTAAGCASADGAGDPALGSESEPLSSCDEASVRAAAPADRRSIIDRALHWVDARVMYSQTSYFEGYRQDCSGFVSMCWGLPTSRVTWQFAPFDTGASHDIAWTDLRPGDALNRKTSDHSEGHIMLFGGWLDSAHSRLCVVQENETGTPANVKAYGKSYFDLFEPVRFNSTAEPPPSPPPAAGDCTVHGDGKLYCTNRPAPMYAEPRDTSAVTDHLQSTYSWFTCWGTGQLHAGGNTTWYFTTGDEHGATGWVAGVNLSTPDAFDADPSAHGLAKCAGSSPPPSPPPPPPDAKDCGMHADGKMWCTNRVAAMYAEPRDTSAVTDHLRSTYSWFTCWGTGQLHAGGNTTWYYTTGDDNGARGWVAGVNLSTPDAFDADPSAHGVPKCN